MKTITLKLKIDDGDASKTIDHLADGLSDLDQTSARQAASSLENLFIKADLKARAIVALTDAVKDSFTEFRTFGKEVANLDTLLEGNQVDSLRKGILQLKPELGQSSELARGMYQALSSGVEAGEALEFIEKSAKAARAGLATTFETVDAGTSVMASFGLKGKDIGSIYDKMFETVKRGKVEMPQLAQSIGLVTNIAAQAGVTLDEMFGAISTSTRTMRPSSAIEGFRSALSNIIKPSKEATELAESLGIQFDATALKSKGFAQFLNEVTTATQGNQQQMATLFGDVQALAFVMSITGNQANQLAEDIKGVSTASGTVDAAFQKQMQSLDAQMTTFKNSVMQGFTSAFTAIEPFLVGVVKFVNDHPAVFAAAVVAVTGLTAAYTLLNTNLALFATSQIPQVLAGLKNIIFLMTNLTLTIQAGTAAEIAAMATGWGALIAVLGIVVYSIANTENAIDRANKVTLDSINANAQALQGYKALSVEAANMADAASEVSQAQVQNGDVHDRLNSILGRLDPVTQEYIKSLGDEKSQIKAVTTEIEKNMDVQQGLLESKLRAASAAVLQSSQEKETIKNQVSARREYIAQADQLRDSLIDEQKNISTNGKSWSDLETGIVKTRSQINSYVSQNIEAEARLKDLNAALGENEVKIIQAAKGLNLNNEQLRQFFLNAGYSTEQTNILTAAYQNATNATNNASNSQSILSNNLNNTANAAGNAAKEVFDLRQELAKLTNFSQIKVDKAIYDVVRLSSNKAEAEAMARRTLENSPDFRKMIQDNRDANERMKAVEDIFTPSERSSGGGGRVRRSRMPNPAADFRRENRIISGNAQWDKWVLEAASKFGIDPMLIFAQMTQESTFRKNAVSNKGASGLMQLMPGTARDLGVKNIFDPKQNIFAGVKYLRQQLDEFDGNVALALAGYNAGSGAVKKYKGIPPYKETQDYVKRISDRYQKLKGGKFELGSNFDYERSLADQSDKLTKETRDAAVLQAIQAARNNGIKPDDDVIRDYNRMLVEEARRQGTVQPDITDTQKEFANMRDRNLDGGLGLEREKTVNEVLRERFDLEGREEEFLTRKLNFISEVSARQDDYNLSLRESQQENQIEAALLAKRNLQLEAAVEFGKQQNNQYRALMDTEVALDVLRQQNADETFVAERRRLAVKSEQLSIEKEITDLQDQISNAGVNDDLKIQAAYLRDILDLRNRETDAVIATNRAQLELSQKTVYSEVQANARVFDYLNRNIKSVNESVGDFKIGMADAALKTIDSPFDALRQRLDGLPPAIRAVGEAFINLANDIIRAFSQSIIQRLLGLNGGGSSSGGGNWFSNILSQIFGGGSSGGFGVSSGRNIGTPGFNPNASGFSASGGSKIGDWLNKTFSFGFGGGSKGSVSAITADGHLLTDGKGASGGGMGLAGGLAIAGIGAQIVGSLIGGRVGSFISNIGGGVGMGASIGTMIAPGIGTAVGAVIGGAVGLLQSLLGGDPKRKIDKNENLPKLQQGFTDALKQLRELAADKNALFSDPQGTLDKALGLRAQIASGFGVDFQSSKYRKIAQQQIAAKLAEADEIIKNIRNMSDEAKIANDTDKRLETNFATGVYMDNAFARQYAQFKRRNGMLRGQWTGRDTLPSMLAMGEMVLNPYQIAQVKKNAGFDAFKNAGIPGYAGGTFVSPTPSPTPNFAPTFTPASATSPQIIVQPKITIVVEGEGISDARIKSVYVESLREGEFEVDLVEAVEKAKSRRIN